MGKQGETIRLTVRMTDEMEEQIRKEAVRRGTNMNQTMIHILNKYFKDQKDQ